MNVRTDTKSAGFSRRRFLANASALGVASLLGVPRPAVAEPPPEVRKIRLVHTPAICLSPQYLAYGSPIFKAVEQKWYKALCRALTKSPKSPEYAVGEGSEPSHIDRSAGVP